MGKYFKYAIGEILLVVIGILIALSINNWNENRKTKNKAKTYVNKIINDLKVDTLNISELIDKSEGYRQNIAKYNSYFNASDSLNLSIPQLLDSIDQLQIYYLNYYPINKTFKDMEFSGNSDLLTDKQRDFLIKLVASQEEFQIINESYIKLSVEESQKSRQLLGHPANFYSELNQSNSKERQTQGLLHQHLFLEAIDNLYLYINARGKTINKLSHKAIQLLQNKKGD